MMITRTARSHRSTFTAITRLPGRPRFCGSSTFVYVDGNRQLWSLTASTSTPTLCERYD